jgi:hypothetical protein
MFLSIKSFHHFFRGFLVVTSLPVDDRDDTSKATEAGVVVEEHGEQIGTEAELKRFGFLGEMNSVFEVGLEVVMMKVQEIPRKLNKVDRLMLLVEEVVDLARIYLLQEVFFGRSQHLGLLGSKYD